MKLSDKCRQMIHLWYDNKITDKELIEAGEILENRQGFFGFFNNYKFKRRFNNAKQKL